MIQPQVPLQLISKRPCHLNDFVGGEEVVKSLLHYKKLPLLTYIWGDAFAGKTFLVSAFHNQLQTAGEKSMVLDALMILDKELLQHIQSSYDFLLIEDVEKLCGNREAETALFNLYNLCQSTETRLLLTAACSQRDDCWRLPDLKSRLNSGLILSVDVLRGDDALQCIGGLFERHGMPLEDAVINYIKTTQNTSLSNLYPLFNQLTIETLKLKRKVTIPMVKQALINIQESEV